MDNAHLPTVLGQFPSLNFSVDKLPTVPTILHIYIFLFFFLFFLFFFFFVFFSLFFLDFFFSPLIIITIPQNRWPYGSEKN